MPKSNHEASVTPPAAIGEDEIRELAHRSYQERGGEPGHEWEDWLRAEATLRHRQQKAQAA